MRLTVPALAVLDVAQDGRKVLVALRLAASEAGSHGKSLIEDLEQRGLRALQLIIADGHKGLPDPHAPHRRLPGIYTRASTARRKQPRSK